MSAPTDNTATADSTAAELPSARLIARRVGLALLAAGAGVALLTALPGFEQLPAHLAGADPSWIAIAAVLQIASTLSFVLAFHGSYDRRVRRRASAGIALAMQGMNILLPAGGSGGLAVGAVMMDRAGVPRGFTASRTVALFLVTSLVTFAAIAAAGLGVATGLLDGDAALTATLVPALGALLVIAAVVALPRVRRNRAATPIPADAGRVRRALVGATTHLHDGIGAAVDLLRGKDPLVIWGSIGYFAFDVASLAAAFHAVGAEGMPIGLLVLAYTLGHAGAIIPLPGSSEGGLVAAFVLYGAALAPVTAAVLAYRAFHAGVPTIMGLAGLADARRQIRRGDLLREPVQSSRSTSTGGRCRALRVPAAATTTAVSVSPTIATR
jgi:uncharacterized membrane protein YbhN (UPF0104 family)